MKTITPRIKLKVYKGKKVKTILNTPKLSDVEIVDEQPISLKFSLNGETIEIYTDNIAKALEEYPIQIVYCKTALMIDATFQGRSYGVVLTIPKLRKLSANKTIRGLLARQLAIGVGSPLN